MGVSDKQKGRDISMSKRKTKNGDGRMTADGLQQVEIPVLSDGKTPMGIPFDHRMPLLEAVNEYLDDLGMDGTLRIHADGVTFLPTDSCAVSLMEDEDHMLVCHECNANDGDCDEDEGGDDE